MPRPDVLQLSALDGFTTRKIWRRERDSNPRYGFPYSGFQDVWIEGVLSRIRSLEAGGKEGNRVNQLSFGNYCSPLCSPEN
jgi:hypothetical protein